MSADRPAASFGELDIVPPTPTDTPTSANFAQPAFETPKTGQAKASTDDVAGGWTPRFADDYSVFATSPDQPLGPFPDLVVSTPYLPQASGGHKRLLSVGTVAAEIASHASHYSPASALPLPPVEPSRRLPSSPTAASPFPGSAETGHPTHSQPRTGKKVRRGTLSDTGSQIVTPPPSARKGERRLAPKPPSHNMQHDEFEADFGAGGPQQQHMLGGFVSAPMEMFGMPLSAPATATAFDDSQGFWDTNMSGMDVDFSIPVTDSFHGTRHNRHAESIDWGKVNNMFQETGVIVPHNQEATPQKKERLLAPKPAPMPAVDTSMIEAPVFAHSFHIPTDDAFPPSNTIGGMDPGLLLPGPPSSGIELATFDSVAQPVMLNNPLSSPQLPPHPPLKDPKLGQLRRSASMRDTSKAVKDERTAISPPLVPPSRPGLLRSASENRGRKQVGRAGSSPGLVPSVRGGVPLSNTRSASQGSRVSGRTSPLKIHQRLSSLSSIPEDIGPRTRTSVQLIIDSRGKARAETTTVVDGKQPTPTRRRHRREERRGSLESSEDSSSSTDDEPIIIPSRNSSFALPPSQPPSYIHPSYTSQSSFSDQASSLGIYYAEPSPPEGDGDSDAETVVNTTVNRDSRGDATSELRKVRENRQKRVAVSSASGRNMQGAPFGLHSTDIPPSSERGNQIRCICNTTLSHINGDGYMVRCGSCEMWLHGRCINVTRQTLPRLYICAFCANTHNAHNVRGRGPQRNNMVKQGSRTSAISPLAHKSARSFR